MMMVVIQKDNWCWIVIMNDNEGWQMMINDTVINHDYYDQ